ncbi:MAG: hypothetical protein EBZ87_05915 [Microbacteriaceae bacterium]|nr:hypothetical protein [Microbacteriaceae bacterium]
MTSPLESWASFSSPESVPLVPAIVAGLSISMFALYLSPNLLAPVSFTGALSNLAVTEMVDLLVTTSCNSVGNNLDAKKAVKAAAPIQTNTANHLSFKVLPSL